MGKIIGKGSFGTVHEASQVDNDIESIWAVKTSKISDDGVPCLMEPIIMSSLVHPNIASATNAKVCNSNLYIQQALAQSSLHTYRSNNTITPDQLKLWAFSLVCAVETMHAAKIIHCDIKCDNVLVIGNDIKLADFSLSVLQNSRSQRFRHDVCTINFRPPECFIGGSWDYKLDMWSLGCSLYELAYGKYLIEHQFRYEPKGKIEDREGKRRVRDRTLMAIISWGEVLKVIKPDSSIPHIPTRNVQYTPVCIPVEFYSPEMEEFNDLLCNLLQINQDNRYTAYQARTHPYFQGMTPPEGYIKVLVPKPISSAESARTHKYFFDYTGNDCRDCIPMAESIYSACGQLKLPYPIKVAACCWIASKIYYGHPPPVLKNYEKSLENKLLERTDPDPSKVLPAERQICNILEFHLLTE